MVWVGNFFNIQWQNPSLSGCFIIFVVIVNDVGIYPIMLGIFKSQNIMIKIDWFIFIKLYELGDTCR